MPKLKGRGSEKKSPSESVEFMQESVTVVNPYAAGIDIGDRIHAVAVNPSCCPGEDPVRTFGTMSCDLEAIVCWLKECQVRSVAMESTGVYWKPLFSLLSRNGFEVCLVNARHVKSMSCHKDDDRDAAWLRKLHSFGMTSSSFLPEAHQEALRSLTRFRATLVREASRYVQRIQKCLELMNVKLHTEIRDIMGVSGTNVIKAILAGERNAEAFLPLLDSRLKADRETLVKSLEGTWLDEQVFLLGECYACYESLQQRMASCDARIEQELQCYEGSQYEGEVRTPSANGPQDGDAAPKPSITEKKRKQKGSPKIRDVRGYITRILGVDVIAIPGMGENSALTIVSETGTDMNKWPTIKQFLMWLNLCPNNRISGGKLISSMVLKRKPQAASSAFRAAAGGVARMNNPLGHYFRRMQAKGGYKYAVVATAAKIATIYYHMVSRQSAYYEQDTGEYEKQHKERTIKRLELRLQRLKADAEGAVV